jgi:hypothetical protein
MNNCIAARKFSVAAANCEGGGNERQNLLKVNSN